MIACDADNLLRHIYHNAASPVEREAIEVYFREQGQEIGPAFQWLGLERVEQGGISAPQGAKT